MAVQEIFIWGYSPGDLGDESPQWVQGLSSGREFGGRSPRKLKPFADIVSRFWQQKRAKFEISHNVPPDSWPVCFTVRARLNFGGRHCPHLAYREKLLSDRESERGEGKTTTTSTSPSEKNLPCAIAYSIINTAQICILLRFINCISITFYTRPSSETQALRFPGHQIRFMGEWVIDWLSTRFFSMG